MRITEQQRYALDCLTYEGITNDREKMKMFFTEYRREHPDDDMFSFRAISKLANYLKWKPCGVNIVSEKEDIIIMGKKWDFKFTPANETAFCDTWFKRMALCYIRLAKKMAITI
jgi:hypothetical protein